MSDTFPDHDPYRKRTPLPERVIRRGSTTETVEIQTANGPRIVRRDRQFWMPGDRP